MIPYGKHSIDDTDISTVVDVLKNHFLTQGKMVTAFEDKLCQITGAKHSLAVNSATSALHLAYLSLGLGFGDVVWTSPITFVATSNAALMCGADIDFVDVDEKTLNMSVFELEKKLKDTVNNNGKLPKVVTPVHMCGNSCEMEKIWELAKKYNFKVIEDASHAIGGSYKEKPVGSCRYSDITIFSFHPVKIVTTGEGGALLTNSSEIAQKALSLRSHGTTKENLSRDEGPWYYEQNDLGYNYRMTDIQAALGISQLEKLDDFIGRRQKIVDNYISFFKENNFDWVRKTKDAKSSNHLMILKVESRIRKNLFDFFHQSNIFSQVHYYPVHLQPYYMSNFNFKAGDFPVAEKVYKKIISLPLFSGLRESEQNIVEQKLLEFFSKEAVHNFNEVQL
jgi:UDP-4-amino-4,6-dideoxy-N-acetyl-beta-L-altrosamine transaminase